MNNIFLINKQGLVNIDFTRIKKLINLVLADKKITGRELTVVFVSDKDIIKTNRKYLNRSTPTDVISFEYAGGAAAAGNEQVLGDIIVSTERGLIRAGEFGKDASEEICQYVIHGLLHLLSYDDTTSLKAARMHREEERLLKRAALRFGKDFFTKAVRPVSKQ